MSGKTNSSAKPSAKLKIAHRFSDPSHICDIQKRLSDSNDSHEALWDVYVKPYQLVVLKDVFEDSYAINLIERALRKIPLFEKRNDLFSFKQSMDLSSVSDKKIQILHKIFDTKICDIISQVFGTKFNNVIDLFCSEYLRTDHLLCHDDMLEDRSVAFIYYLVPSDWHDDFGGHLAMLESSEKDKQLKISKSILPVRNSLAFFKVSSKSYHQVCEVLKDKSRLSITGWFHCDSNNIMNDHQLIIRSVNTHYTQPSASPKILNKNAILEFTNHHYLLPDNADKIMEHFLKSGEAQLVDFLQTDFYLKVLNELELTDPSAWTTVSHPLVCHYQVLKKEQSLQFTNKLMRFFTSNSFCLLLNRLTDFGTNHATPFKCKKTSNSTPELKFSEDRVLIHCQLEKWIYRSFSLLPTSEDSNSNNLQAVFYLLKSGWVESSGGYTSYLHEGEEKFRVIPSGNCLSLVDTSDGPLQFFTKYINCDSEENDDHFYRLFVIFCS